MKTRLLFHLLLTVVFNTFVGATAASAIGFDATAGALISNALSLIPRGESMALFAGVNKEIWLAELMENFYPDISFLNRSRDMSPFVENNTLHLASAGVDPNVLVNNSVWPIPFAQRADVPEELPLDTLDTENTLVRNVEEMEASYDKMSSVVKGHKKALVNSLARRAAHAWTPDQNAAETPVLATTGADDGNNFKKITLDDVANLATEFDLLEIPKEDRILVLHPKHQQQLRAEDRELFKPTMSTDGRKIVEIEGFEVYSYTGTPVFNKGTGVKAAFGAAAAPATDTISSFAYHADEVCKAQGDFDMFDDLKNPYERGDIVGFQMRALALPMRGKAMGAIYAAAV
ncbi:MAG: hypothetical protein EP346_06965 [Bacteroidetes bacterium]|nr:MAG: hypothetical protein EP346_06965 [Bacteroidota bacterium]